MKYLHTISWVLVKPGSDSTASLSAQDLAREPVAMTAKQVGGIKQKDESGSNLEDGADKTAAKEF